MKIATAIARPPHRASSETGNIAIGVKSRIQQPLSVLNAIGTRHGKRSTGVASAAIRRPVLDSWRASLSVLERVQTCQHVLGVLWGTFCILRSYLPLLETILTFGRRFQIFFHMHTRTSYAQLQAILSFAHSMRQPTGVSTSRSWQVAWIISIRTPLRCVNHLIRRNRVQQKIMRELMYFPVDLYLLFEL